MRHERIPRRLLWIGGAAGLIGFWFLCTSQVSVSESVVGALATALTLASVRTVLVQHLAPFRPRLSWLVLAWRLPGYVVTGTYAILRALIKRLAGKDPASVLRRVPFDPGGEDARSAARRALVITFTTVAPNFIIVGIDREERTMLVHQVQKTDIPWVARALGARP